MKPLQFKDILFDYVKEKIKLFLVFIICTLIYIIVFFLYYVEIEAVLYAFVFCLFFLLILASIDFSHYYKQRKALERIKNKITFDLEYLHHSSTPLIKDYEEIIQILIENIKNMQIHIQTYQSDMNDYYTLWAHQIKLPISAMNLLLQSQDNSENFKLSAELLKIEQYVDMVLSYIRLNSDTTDYVIKEYDLDEIIKTAIRKLSIIFIQKRIRIEFHETNQKVLTDEKWLEYVIEQLLSNAVKYTHQGYVSIYYQNDQLIIQDTGIGIEKADLNRIFERGFTGYNGRSGEKSSGLGLYLCQKILKNLSHHIMIESTVNVGTKVMIDLTHEDIKIE